jgi:D-alanine-D-alanine ligase
MKEKIAVLAGGTSCEREISLISGKAVYGALSELGYPVIFVDAVGDFMETLKRENATFAFIALHGTFGEDGTVQRLLEKEGIAYTGPGPEASELAFDKEAAQTLFQKEGIRVPPFFVLKSAADIGKKPPLGTPLVVKPAKAGSSVGVTLLKDPEGYETACCEAFRYSDTVLVDRYIPGRELTVGVLGEQPLPVVEVKVRRAFYDYEAKYRDAATQYEFPAKLTETERLAVTAEALKAYRALGAEVMSRVDLILGEDGLVYVLEVNTVPGLTSKSLLPKAAKAAGIHFPELCVKIMTLSMAKGRVVS